MNNFLNYIDTFKNQKLNYFEIVDILRTTDIDYSNNQYLRKINKNTLKEHTWWSRKYKSRFSSSDKFFNSFGSPPKLEKITSYELWKKNHQVFESNSPLCSSNPFDKPDKIINIEVSVTTLKDLIGIIENNPFDEFAIYNIDLRSLHCIKNELYELDNMIGMDSIKLSVINQLLYFIQKLHINKDASDNYCADYKHTVIYGSPGTGKTEIAQIIGKMYSKIGILKKNVFKKVTRSDLVAGYLGQTALKTNDVIQSCLGGCLFIDEAYSLVNNDLDSFSKECIDTLNESLSRYKDNLMVIIAGYEKELNEIFFTSNPGLESRFIWRFKITPYTAKELFEILKKKIEDINWKIENDNLDYRWFEEKKDNFKNYGRDIELLLSNIKISHSRRIFGKDIEFRKKINIDDFNNGYKEYLKNKNIVPKVFSSLYV